MIKIVFICKRCLCEITLEGNDSKKLIEVLHESHKLETNCNHMYGRANVFLGEREVTNFHINVYH